MTEQTYFAVRFDVFAFETKEAAEAFADRLTDLFMDMPEAKDLAATALVSEKSINE